MSQNSKHHEIHGTVWKTNKECAACLKKSVHTFVEKYMKYSQRVVAVLAPYIQNGQWLKVNLYTKTI